MNTISAAPATSTTPGKIARAYLIYFHYPIWNIRFGIRWPGRWPMPPPTLILWGILAFGCLGWGAAAYLLLS